MLEGLERADWERLEHAYGSAGDMPAWAVRGKTPADDAEPDLVAEVVSALEDGRIPEQASTLLEDLVGACLRGWDER